MTRTVLMFLCLLLPLCAQEDDGGFGFFGLPAPEPPSTSNLYSIVFTFEGFPEMIGEVPDDPFGGDPLAATDPLAENPGGNAEKDISSLLERFGMQGGTATWDGGDQVTVVGTRDDILLAKKVFKLLCCSAVQVRLSLVDVSFPTKALGASLRRPDARGDVIFRRFAAGEGKLMAAESTLTISGIETTLGTCTIMPTMLTSDLAIHLQVHLNGKKQARTSLVAMNDKPVLLRSHQAGEELRATILTASVVHIDGSPYSELDAWKALPFKIVRPVSKP